MGLKLAVLPALLLVVLLLPASQPLELFPEEPAVKNDDFRVLQIIAHDDTCFTEGLEFNSQGRLV
jgi:hypothetical protein